MGGKEDVGCLSLQQETWCLLALPRKGCSISALKFIVFSAKYSMQHIPGRALNLTPVFHGGNLPHSLSAIGAGAADQDS